MVKDVRHKTEDGWPWQFQASAPVLHPISSFRKATMGFFKRLLGGVSSKPEKRYYIFQVKCKNCGEMIEGRVDLDNDLSLEYEGNKNVYFGRKVLMGSGRCFQQIEAEFKFTSARELIEKQVQGGTFVE